MLSGRPDLADGGFQELVDSLPVGVYVCEAPSGIIRLYNRRAAELWGRQPKLGDSDERFCGSLRLHRRDGSPLPHSQTPMAEVLRDGQAREGEVVIERPDGSRVVVRVSLAPLRDGEGRLLGAVNTFQDVTRQAEAEDALRLGEARYRAIVEDQPEMVCRFLPDGTMSFANEAYCRFFGLRREAIIGRSYSPVVHPDDLARVQSEVAALSPDNRVVVIENRVLRADGAVRWTRWTNVGLYDREGRLFELQSTGRDVTESRRAEAELKATVQTLEQLYMLADLIGRAQTARDVCEAAVEAVMSTANADRASVLLLDEAGVMRFVAWRRLSGAYRKAVEGHSPWPADARDPAPILVEDAFQDPGLADLHDVFASEGIRALGFLPLVHQGRLLGKFMLYYNAPHAFTPDELRVAATVAQHTAFGLTRVQAEAAVEELLGRERTARQEADEARTQAERASRAKDEFLAMLAHELRNPLSVVVNAVAIVDASQGLPVPAQRATQAMRRQVEHLSRLLDDLLDVARISTGQFELARRPMDLRSTVAEAAEAHRYALERKSQRLEVSLPEEPVSLMGDPVRLLQVVGNLLTNASKYTPSGGSIQVTLSAEEGGEALLRVKDDGAGIPADQLEPIFELFAQANRSLARTEGGLGIGLTLVRRVVELHGGTVQARSEGPQRGSEFTVRLPRLVQAAPADPPPPPAAAGRGRRILVIEDHQDGREMLAATLRQEGYEVVEAATGREGIAAARSHSPEVVLLDIGLPDIEGYEVGRQLRRTLGAAVKIVALTGYGQPGDRARSQDAGFDAHLVKPVDPVRLAQTLEGLSQAPLARG